MTEETKVITTETFQEELMVLLAKYKISEHPLVFLVFNEDHFEMVSNLQQDDIPEFLIDVVTSRPHQIGRMLLDDNNLPRKAG
jgi:hypothetical protein